jgi:hypothetical protein
MVPKVKRLRCALSVRGKVLSKTRPDTSFIARRAHLKSTIRL